MNFGDDLFYDLLNIEEDNLSENDFDLDLTPTEKLISKIRFGDIPENVFLDNSFPDGKTVLHILAESLFLTETELIHASVKMMRLGVDPRIRDNFGKLCTDYRNTIIKTNYLDVIYYWILTKYPTIWSKEYYMEHRGKIIMLGYNHHYDDIVKIDNENAYKAMKNYYKK
jgi:hypothetical protein